MEMSLIVYENSDAVENVIMLSTPNSGSLGVYKSSNAVEVVFMLSTLPLIFPIQHSNCVI